MKIYFVDEDEDLRETFQLMLQDCFPKSDDSPKVHGIAPAPEMADMRFLVEDQEAVAIILDERLKESGVAQYFGNELATYLRNFNQKIPIYILTSFTESEELLDAEMDVEDILDKQELAAKKDIVGARILRRIDSYLDIGARRDKRFEMLIRKSMKEGLDAEEIRELEDLEFYRESPFEIDEIISNERLQKLNELEEKINSLEMKISGVQ